MHYACRSRALPWSALFIACLLSSAGVRSQAASCLPDRIDETARVEWVYDGDTIRLADGRKLRLIGIDTPELGRKDTPAQPYSRKASNKLTKLLQQHDHEVLLRFVTLWTGNNPGHTTQHMGCELLSAERIGCAPANAGDLVFAAIRNHSEREIKPQ